jgi:DNA-binding response OmpR family regulator
VDDEAAIRFSLTETLTRDGYRAVAVESGEEALQRIETEDFDLALIDLKLKGIGGMEVLAALRDQSANTTIIVLTAHASLETAVEALRQGAHDYLFKPCKTADLRESVRTGLLKRERELRQAELLHLLEQYLSTSLQKIQATPTGQPALRPRTIGETPKAHARFQERDGLLVDLMRHVISLDGNLLELSPTEFDLLAHLISEAPRVVSPQELVREAQGYTCRPQEASDIIRYHVYRIRRKAEAAAGRSDIIRTVRGVGYAVGD